MCWLVYSILSNRFEPQLIVIDVEAKIKK